MELMNGFIADQLLQEQSRGLPADALQAQEATVEPRPEQMLEVRVEGVEVRSVARESEQIFPQSDQRLHGTRRGIDAAKQFLPGRLDGGGKRCKILRAGRALVLCGCTTDGSFIG